MFHILVGKWCSCSAFTPLSLGHRSISSRWQSLVVYVCHHSTYPRCSLALTRLGYCLKIATYHNKSFQLCSFCEITNQRFFVNTVSLKTFVLNGEVWPWNSFHQCRDCSLDFGQEETEGKYLGKYNPTHHQSQKTMYFLWGLHFLLLLLGLQLLYQFSLF